MRVALYVTCLVDLMRPSVGFAALRLVEATGCEVVVPAGQTCCGQPAWSAGERAAAAALAKQAVAELEGFDAVVVPSGSCAEHMRRAWPELLADEAPWAERARNVGERCHELTSFLVDVMHFAEPPATFAGRVTYHDSCKGLRGLGIKRQPRQLLAMMSGLRLDEMAECEECCGFGGAFAVEFGEISTQIVDRKCASIAAVGADAVVGGDLGCLLNIEGRQRRRGDRRTRVLHIAEVLAGGSAA
jgi:L-lactate dehydrogenase complex protein LldE